LAAASASGRSAPSWDLEGFGSSRDSIAGYGRPVPTRLSWGSPRSSSLPPTQVPLSYSLLSLYFSAFTGSSDDRVPPPGGSVLAISRTLNSMTTVLPLLAKRAEVIAGQSLLSLGQSAAAVLPVWGHHKLVPWQGMKEGWETALLFGLMWSVAWGVWGALSPFGSYVSRLLRRDASRVLTRLIQYKLNRPGLTSTFPRARTSPDAPLPMDGSHWDQSLPGYDGLFAILSR
jgi:hypothetical protein